MKTNQNVFTLSQYLLYLFLFAPGALCETIYPFCVDSTDYFNLTLKGVTYLKDCEYVRSKPARCHFDEVPWNCPVTCGYCACTYNLDPFEVYSDTFQSGSETKTCDWVKENPSLRCNASFNGTATNCPLYCGDCNEAAPSSIPTISGVPLVEPSLKPTDSPSLSQSESPTGNPSILPSHNPSTMPSLSPTSTPSFYPTKPPSARPSFNPSINPSFSPSEPLCPIQEFFGKTYYYKTDIFLKCLKIDLASNGFISVVNLSTASSRCSEDLSFTTISQFDSFSLNKATAKQVGDKGFSGSLTLVIDPDLQNAQDDVVINLDTLTSSKTFELSMTAKYCSSPSLIPSVGPSVVLLSSPSVIHSKEPSLLPSTHPSSLPTYFPTTRPSCEVDEILGRTFYTEILDGLCLKLEFFENGTMSRASSLNSECDYRTTETFEAISFYQGHSNGTATFSDKNNTLGNDAWYGEFVFKKDPSQIDLVMDILEHDTEKNIVRGAFILSSCIAPSSQPSDPPSMTPTLPPTDIPSQYPTLSPSSMPSLIPSSKPSSSPSIIPSSIPSTQPSSAPSFVHSEEPSNKPSSKPSSVPSSIPTASPSSMPSLTPSTDP